MKIIQREKQNFEVKKKLLKRQKEQEDTTHLQQQEGNLNQFFRRTAPGSNYFFSLLTFLPKQLYRSSGLALSRLNEQFLLEEKQTVSVSKVRPPRFVSFRMELEPYNEQKALALQILNDINLSVFQTETIDKVFSFKYNSFILTGKRLICVQMSDKQKSNYMNWNIPFRDIMKISLWIFDRRLKRNLSAEEINEMLLD